MVWTGSAPDLPCASAGNLPPPAPLPPHPGLVRPPRVVPRLTGYLLSVLRTSGTDHKNGDDLPDPPSEPAYAPVPTPVPQRGKR